VFYFNALCVDLWWTWVKRALNVILSWAGDSLEYVTTVRFMSKILQQKSDLGACYMLMVEQKK